MEINMLKPIKVDAKYLHIHCKVCDRFEAELRDAQGELLKLHEGYVPDFMPGAHYGDYLILTIDMDSGQITNWTVPSAEDIQRFINKEGD